MLFRSVVGGDHLQVIVLETFPEFRQVMFGTQGRGEDVLGTLEVGPVFHTATSGAVAATPTPGRAAIAFVIGVAFSLAGIGLGLRIWLQRAVDPQRVFSAPGLRLLPHLSERKFYADEVYDAVLVRPVRSLGSRLRRVVEPRVMDGWIRGLTDTASDFGQVFRTLQTGLIRDYAAYMVAFVVLFTIAAMLFAGTAK